MGLVYTLKTSNLYLQSIIIQFHIDCRVCGDAVTVSFCHSLWPLFYKSYNFMEAGRIRGA